MDCATHLGNKPGKQPCEPAVGSRGDYSELASPHPSPQPKNIAVLRQVGTPGAHLWSSTAWPLPAVFPALAHALSCAELPAGAHTPPSALGWSSELLRAAIEEHTSGDHVSCMDYLCKLRISRCYAHWGGWFASYISELGVRRGEPFGNSGSRLDSGSFCTRRSRVQLVYAQLYWGDAAHLEELRGLQW